MKIRLYVLALLAMVLLIPACKDDDGNPSDPGGEQGDTQNYFPSGIGTYYRFNVEVEDTANGIMETGQRTSRYTRTETKGGTLYTEQADTVFMVSGNENGTAFFRKSATGVFYYLDTTGISETIPDSLMQYVSFDSEFRILKFPVASGDTWPVFKLDLNYGAINLNLIDVTATAEGTENITLNLLTGQETKEALKIRYVLTLKVPDPQNPLSTITSTFTARGWIVKNIGFAHWTGNASVMNAFSGSGIDFDDTTATATQNLIEYTIR